MVTTQRTRDWLTRQADPLRLLFWLGRPCPAPGFDVRVYGPDADEGAAAGVAVRAALALVAEHDARRYACLRRDLPNVCVTYLPGALARCVAPLRMCVLDADYVLAPATTAGRLAQTLVHEGAHARLLRAGVGYAEPVRARVERICVGQEAAFARRLPDGAALVARALARRNAPAYARPELYSNRAQRARTLAWLRHELRELGRLVREIAGRDAV